MQAVAATQYPETFGCGKETAHAVERGSSLCAAFSVQTFQVHKDLGYLVESFGVAAATDRTLRTLFTSTSPRMKMDSCGERRGTKRDFKWVAMATT
jgi:hypothetical protein